jgi:hypothetical protein
LALEDGCLRGWESGLASALEAQPAGEGVLRLDFRGGGGSENPALTILGTVESSPSQRPRRGVAEGRANVKKRRNDAAVQWLKEDGASKEM